MIGTILNNLLDLLLLVALWLFGAGLGRVVLARLGLVGSLTALERLIIGGAVGLGAISYAVLLVGWAGFLSLLPISVVMLLLLALAATQARGVLADTRAASFGISNLSRRPITALLTIIMLIAAGAALIGALAPATDWDPLVYHLAFPRLYIQQGQVFDILFDHRGEFPQNSEMLYTLALLFGRAGLAGLLHWSMAVASTAAVYSFCRARLTASRTFSTLAAAIFLTTPLTLTQATTANVDLNVAFYNFIALYAFFVWAGIGRVAAQQGEINPASATPHSALSAQHSALILTGILAGLSYSTKQSSVINGVAIALLIGWWLLRAERRGVMVVVKTLAVYGLVTLATLLVWPLKAWLASGNPFWPAAYGLFGGKAWSKADNDFQYYGYSVLYGMRYPAGTAWTELGTSQSQNLVSAYLLWPWNATMHSGTFDAGPRWVHSIGPLYLALLPISAIIGLVRRVSARSPLLLLSIYALVYALGWLFFLHHMVRFFLFALPPMAILVAAAAWLLMGKSIGEEQAPARGYAYAPIIAALLGLFVLLGAADIAYDQRGNVAVVVGSQSATDYLNLHAPGYPTLDWANHNLPANAKVLMGWGALGYYLDRPYIYAEHAPEYVGRYINRPPQDFRVRLQQLGITHIIIAYPAQFAIREVFPPGFVSDNGPYTQLISPPALPWKVYVLK